MKTLDLSTALSGLFLLASLPLTIATHDHAAHRALARLEKRHRHSNAHHRRSSARGNESAEEPKSILKRGGQCQFPTNAGLVAVTPDQKNAGWAMSPDQPCMPGNYCPYACPPGQLMAQWDPMAISYTYPLSMVSVRNSVLPL